MLRNRRFKITLTTTMPNYRFNPLKSVTYALLLYQYNFNCSNIQNNSILTSRLRSKCDIILHDPTELVDYCPDVSTFVENHCSEYPSQTACPLWEPLLIRTTLQLLCNLAKMVFIATCRVRFKLIGLFIRNM